MPSFAFHPGFAGQSIRCNPWNPTQFIMTAADNFGVTGSGKVYIVELTPGPQGPMGIFRCLGAIGTSDGAFDACFSEVDGGVFVAACGDGVKMYNMGMLNADGVVPQCHAIEHQAEVSSVMWNPVSHESYLTASWDSTIKLWQAGNPAISVMTFAEHMKEVYEANWNPRDAFLFASCGGDGFMKMWDMRNPQKSVLSVPGHQGQIVLSVDWNKYDTNLIATGGVDQMAKLWDIRRPQRELFAFRGHQGAVRRVRFSPHSRSQLLTSGYDFRVCLWDLERPQRPMTHRYEQHREFVVGAEWSMAAPGIVLSAGWDGIAYAWQMGTAPIPTHMQQPPLPPCVPPPRTPAPRREGPGGPMMR